MCATIAYTVTPSNMINIVDSYTSVVRSIYWSPTAGDVLRVFDTDLVDMLPDEYL